MKHKASPSALAVIGGTGMYEINGLKDISEHAISTPFGNPSSPIIEGKIGDTTLLFLARHGRGHTLLPGEINYRANIWALKSLGAMWCVSVSAVGSLKEEMAPGHAVVPNQFVDRTKNRIATFFGNGIVGHIAFATPFCPVLSEALFSTANELARTEEPHKIIHKGATYLCMEGPAFSTRAESQVYRSLGASIIGMTNLTEAKLCREAEISYASLALVTDYDCWRSENDDVDIAEILHTLKENTHFARKVVGSLAPKICDLTQPDLVANSLSIAIVTPPDYISEDVKERLWPIIGRYYMERA